ncbi:hypothetical protein ElyMa_006456800 [Elysia marginata]|uniref:Secreted protein n=1 Tax=Elysia marginata TaxID=1093978 RepID=A0AAV4I0D3_9GAST|nr:hypothetical protein ElyMa_006456800 [Elysia marginata]
MRTAASVGCQWWRVASLVVTTCCPRDIQEFLAGEISGSQHQHKKQREVTLSGLRQPTEQFRFIGFLSERNTGTTIPPTTLEIIQFS